MKKTLLLFAHPAMEKSRANAALLEAVRDLDHVTVNDLYAEYPDFLINVDREQELLEKHERIVIQHPFFWYSTPAIMKEWFDLVLEYGWAYGDEGNALQGKTVLTAMTTGGGKSAYCPQGYNQFTIEEFLRPAEQTARLCQMKYEKPFVVYGSLQLSPDDLNKACSEYREILTSTPRIDGV
ncbi:MAG: NAD(P)H-dependent oxidoreductase [Verrucomicrobiota bacterium]